MADLAPPPPPQPPIPADPKERENFEKILASPSYVRAEKDLDYIASPGLRGVRLLLELQKAEDFLDKEGIRSTIVVFGGARLAPGSPWYEEARDFGRIVSTTCQRGELCDYVVCTGGGPGAMEAANRGAYDVEAKSIGLNIQLPHEQWPNAYITPSLCFQFHYFGIRKMHFLLRAKALVAFPGGFGTIDELFETLTLIQTGKMKRVPVVLVSRAYWETAINWNFLAEQGAIARADMELISYAESGSEAWNIIAKFYAENPSPEASPLR